MGYIEARLKIYAPLYAKSVEMYAKDVLEELQRIHDSGTDIALFDFDGYKYVQNRKALQMFCTIKNERWVMLSY